MTWKHAVYPAAFFQEAQGLPNPLPYFPFWIDDFETSKRVRSMTDAEVGIYVFALCAQWRNGSIPVDPGAAARELGRPVRGVRAAWPVVSECFEVDPSNPSRMLNRRQECERLNAIEKSRSASESAKRRYERSANALRTQQDTRARSSSNQEKESDDHSAQLKLPATPARVEPPSKPKHADDDRLTPADDDHATPLEVIARGVERHGQTLSEADWRWISNQLELRGITAAAFAASAKPHLNNGRLTNAVGFLKSLVKEYGSKTRKVRIMPKSAGSCSACAAGRLASGGYCDCGMGRDLKRAESRRAQ